MTATAPRPACLLLDIGGVLELTPDTGWLPDWEQRLGLAPGTVNSLLGETWRAGSVGHVDEAQVRARTAAALHLDTTQLDAFMADLWDEYLGSPNVELLSYVRDLTRHQQLRIGILSNSFVGAREREADRYRLDTLVERPEHLVYSHEIGILKPDPRAFAVACTTLDVRPQDCLFVDDAAPNVEAARAAGLRAHLFEDNATTLTRIAAHLAQGVAA
ncbi:HAD family hydrolase [Streptomyces sp. NPDC087440]|uniref:HAD family hydrolase n=1 Tax=Streptomyces sp. NPDC087440 TaxID=3365790 RepID=UPI00382FC891